MLKSTAQSTRGHGLVVAACVAGVLGVVGLAAMSWEVSVVSETARPGIDGEAGGVPSQTVHHETLLGRMGWQGVAALGGPLLLLSAAPLLARRRGPALLARGASTLLLLSGVVLGVFSIGVFYLPSALLMLVATIVALVSRPRAPAATAGSP